MVPAFFDSRAVYFGDGSRYGFYPLGVGFILSLNLFSKKIILKNLQSCQDVVAHEMGHNLTSIASQLEYTGESGCLNEAFSDLFGEMVENFATGSNDFLIAKDCMKNVSSLKINSIK